MKSRALKDVVIGLYEAILTDLFYISPIIRAELDMVSRVHSLYQSRGMALFTIAFPDLGKFLERGLDSGQLPDVRPPLGGRLSIEDQRPEFLRTFWSLIFDADGMLLPSPNVDAIAGLRQLLFFAKKLRLECDQEIVDDTLIEFTAVDESLPPSHDGTWDYDDPIWDRRSGHPLWGVPGDPRDQPDLIGRAPLPADSHDWGSFRLLCGLVTTSFGELKVWDLEPKHGPGAVADGLPIKYELSHWPDKLERVFPADWFASHDLVDRSQSNREFPSKVLCVPKTQKGPRIIAAEPTSHQWCQGAIERWLRDAIGRSHIRFSIDLRDQEPSRAMALQASIDGLHATVDLSAASDRLSTRLVEYVFQHRPDILDALHATRTRTYRMPDGTIGKLRKFACMGSACTFPIQTIVFTIVAIYAVLEERGLPVTAKTVREVARQVRVFGDDIIIPVDAYPRLTSLLTECGLKVNTAKSFGTGKFRESCGMDAYLGVDVTPAYFLEPYSLRNPESLVSIIAVSNNFYKKGLWTAADWLLNTVDPQVRKRLRIANRDIGSLSLYSCAPDETHLRVRFNPETHVMEVLTLTVTSQASRSEGSGEASLLQFFSERGDKSLLEEAMKPDGSPERELGQSKRPDIRLGVRWVLAEDRLAPGISDEGRFTMKLVKVV